MINLLASI